MGELPGVGWGPWAWSWISFPSLVRTWRFGRSIELCGWVDEVRCGPITIWRMRQLSEDVRHEVEAEMGLPTGDHRPGG